MKFIDGHVLKGQWGLKRGLWVLRNGTLRSENEDKIIFTFNAQNECYRDQNKEIHSQDNEKGFFIKINKYISISDDIYEKVFISA